MVWVKDVAGDLINLDYVRKITFNANSDWMNEWDVVFTFNDGSDHEAGILKGTQLDCQKEFGDKLTTGLDFIEVGWL